VRRSSRRRVREWKYGEVLERKVENQITKNPPRRVFLILAEGLSDKREGFLA
jgi:hypothetical protein